MTLSLEADLRDRWRPSDEQVNQADALLATGVDQVLTLHLLINKRWGFWTKDIRVQPLDGVFTDRDAALRYLAHEAESLHEAGITVCGGYTYHHAPGEWAVFDDIMSCFPKEGR